MLLDKLYRWVRLDGGTAEKFKKKQFLIFLFYSISSRESRVSHRQMNAVICGQDNPIRAGFAERNAIKSLKRIGYLRGDKRRIR